MVDKGYMNGNYDVIIIGSGSAGLVSAIQAYELGLKPIIIEKMPSIGGNTKRASSGMNATETTVQQKKGIQDTTTSFYDDTYRIGHQKNDPALLKYFVAHSNQAIEWLAQHHILLEDLTLTAGMTKKRTHRPASTAPIGQYLINGLLSQIKTYHIPILLSTKVTALKQNSQGWINGVTIATKEQSKETVLHGRTVILATGGFAANQKLIQQYSQLIGYPTTNQAGATGDGLFLAETVGAQLCNLEDIQIHPTAHVNQVTGRTYLIGESLRGEGGILVNRQGKRFVNELADRQIVSVAIEHDSFLIFDQRIRERSQAVDFYDKMGFVQQGATISELAYQTHLDTKRLRDTLENWEKSVRAHNDPDFKRPILSQQLPFKSPFYAIRIQPAVHYTMGGVRINTKTEVMNEQQEVIHGLFAAGEVTSGLHGDNRVGGNSIAETIVFGQQAGRQAAQYIQRLVN